MNSKSTIITSALIAGLSLPATAQDVVEATGKTMPKMDIVETASKAGQFKTLLAAATAAGLVDTLKSKGPFTLFAPTDDAFAKLPKGAVAKLLKNKAKLAEILTYHVVAGRVPAKTVVGMSWAATVQGQSIHVQVSKKGVMVDDAKVVKTDIHASNGIIHVIDSVIMPRADIVDTAIEAGQFKTLVAAIKAAKLVGTLKGDGPFTVFAPVDSAFAALPEGTVPALLKDIPKLKSILTYHVVSGRVRAEDIPMALDGDAFSAQPVTVNGQKLEITRTKKGVMVNGAKVVKANIIVGNGVIHVIDKVMLPK